MSPTHALLPPEPPNEEADALRTLLHSTQDELAAALKKVAQQEEELESETRLVEWQNERAFAAEAERDTLRTQLAYSQQQRRSLQESATQQVEGLKQEVATLKGRLEEVGAQLLCTVRECAALLRRLRGAA